MDPRSILTRSTSKRNVGPSSRISYQIWKKNGFSQLDLAYQSLKVNMSTPPFIGPSFGNPSPNFSMFWLYAYIHIWLTLYAGNFSNLPGSDSCPTFNIADLQRSWFKVYRSRTPKPSNQIPLAEFNGFHRCGKPKCVVDKMRAESHLNLPEDTCHMLSGSGVWIESEWAPTFQPPHYPWPLI